ncbi:MAG: hypothetical protein MJ153_08355, partial [Clostridia bacterium]|nr:hypothetical protein [Clostridia bacterium]
MKKILSTCTCTAIAVACMATVSNADVVKEISVLDNNGSFVLCEENSLQEQKDCYIKELEKIKVELKSYAAISYVDTVEGLIRKASSAYAANRQYCNAFPEIKRLETEFLDAYDKAEEDFIYVYNTYVKHEE